MSSSETRSTSEDRASRSSPRVPRIVSIGGGTGLSTLLRGLKQQQAELAAVVSVTDDGGSSGRLREELGVLPPGDIRNCMVALSEDEALMSRLFQHRFSSIGSNGGLHDHSFGNLFLSAMSDITGDFAEAIRLTSEVLAIKGTIFPATTSNASLRARLGDGEWISGETRITADRRRIERLELVPSGVRGLPEAMETIRSADILTIGPASLYTSLIASLLPEGMVSAIEESPARKIYIQNIMTQPAETANMTVSAHLQALIDHCGKTLFPTVLVNTGTSAAILRKYEQEGASVVEFDRKPVEDLGVTAIERDLLAEDVAIRHDSDLLADALLEITGGLNGSTQHFILKGRGEVYAERKAIWFHSGRADRDVGAVAARGVAESDRARVGERGIVYLLPTGPLRGHPASTTESVQVGTEPIGT